MSPKLYILATVRNPALLEATLLVFKTVRVGFPTAEIEVHGNALEWYALAEVSAAAEAVEAKFSNRPALPHDAWIELLLQEPGPVWICDTDIVFFERVENWFNGDRWVDLAGRFEPEFNESFTGTRHMERLHTSLMFLNRDELAILVRQWMARVPPPWGLTGQMNLVRQSFIPLRGDGTLFYDTCAGLWHAGIGVPFSEKQNAAFEHLHCGTYSDLAGEKIGLPRLAEMHRQIYENPALARGIQKQQAEYYAKRRPRSQLVIGEHTLNIE